ncbi:hypothetical protein HZR84_01195 [Hyphobacterium sp. CCMP332]|nr:hypothetical protein HZR84_01195 [Hyphobacterium sp. CCMP332]
MDKKKVLIASVLKPVNEPRMYKKLGLSLAEFPNLDVHIAGFSSNNKQSDNKISFHPIFNFKRISLGRMQSNYKFLALLNRIKPEILIVNTFELLNSAIKYKKNNDCFLIYDIRENHSLNVSRLGIYPFPLNHLLATYIRNIELKASRQIDHFFLAEKCYLDELPFIGPKHTVLENKYQGEKIRRNIFNPDNIRFAFTGTAHHSTGIFKAINFVDSINKLGQKAQLNLCIHATKEDVYSRLNKISYPWLSGEIKSNPVDNYEIIEVYKRSDVLLAPYHVNEQNRNKFPTKLYDALANGIPMIISENNYWKKNCNPKAPLIHFDFNSSPDTSVIEAIKLKIHSDFKDESALWNSEKIKLNFLNTVLDSS